MADSCFRTAYGYFGNCAGVGIAAYEREVQFAFYIGGIFSGQFTSFCGLPFGKLCCSGVSSASFSFAFYCDSIMHGTATCFLGLLRRNKGCGAY